jgi:hypothetical protein
MRGRNWVGLLGEGIVEKKVICLCYDIVMVVGK